MMLNNNNIKKFIPVSRREMKDREWDYLDIVLVTPDAYIDHPSFGTAMIGRILENNC